MSAPNKSENMAAPQTNGSAQDIHFGTFSPRDLEVEPKVSLPPRCVQSSPLGPHSSPSKRNGFDVRSLLPKVVQLESVIRWNGENWSFVEDTIQIGHKEEKQKQVKATNWAKTLFKAPQNAAKPQRVQVQTERKEERPLVSVEEALLLKVEDLALEPRGFVNERNKCFLNVVLQVLIASPPFLALVGCLSRARMPNNAQVLGNFVKLVTELGVPTIKGTPLSPRYFYPLLNRFNPKYGTQHVYQEDAQEFLSFLLDRMHEEMLSITKNRTLPAKEEPEGEEEEEDWQEVGKGNKTSIIVTKEEAFASSPITSIFGGKLRISLKKHNAKSSVSIQPFFCLHLDIQHPAVHTLEDALEFFSTKEFLEGVTDSTTNIEVEASKHTTLESLPKTLIFHLKRFSFDEGTQKLGKFISFPNTLTIKPHLVSAKVHANQRKYQLLAVVSHLGTQATNGHYTCDIRQKGQWIHFDDTTVYKTTEEQVASRVAYILVYQQQPK